MPDLEDLANLNETIVKATLGILIILYGAYSLLSKYTFKLESDNKTWLFICGFLSGILGGVYGLNGPPVVIYGDIRNWTATHFRATLQAYFLPASTLGMVGYWSQGLWTSTVSYCFSFSIPVVVPTIFPGRYLNQQLEDGSFLKYVYVGLICVGLILMGQSFR